MLNVNFTPRAWEDFQYWQAQDKKTLKRVLKLINEAGRTPFKGMGKVERLGNSLSGCWSRRIDDTNRMVYMVEDENLILIQLRYHY